MLKSQTVGVWKQLETFVGGQASLKMQYLNSLASAVKI